MGCGNSKSQLLLVRVDTRVSVSDEKQSVQTVQQSIQTAQFVTQKREKHRLPRLLEPKVSTHTARLSYNDGELGSDTGDGLEVIELEKPRILDPNPPVKPPRKKREKVVPSSEQFKKIDDHALNAPEDVLSFVSYLAQYLAQPASNDMEKVRAFFRWIAHNICYDRGIFTKRGRPGPQDALSVLRRLRGVCEGYSNLFLALCREVQIPCKKISGFSKALGYDPETTITVDSNTDHAWNIVYVEGDWWPIDATWAAGTVDKQTRTFKRHFTELYFLTDPKDFAIKHFPYMNNSYDESCCYQLLANPLSIEEFNTAIAPHTDGIEWGFQSQTHRQVVDLDKVCEIQIATSKVKIDDVSCEFKGKQTGKDFKTYVLLRKLSDSAFTVKITPPETGKYELTLFGKRDQYVSEHKPLMTYIIRCHSVMANVASYPEHTGTWGIRIPFASYGFFSDIGNIDVITAKAGRTEIKVKVSPDIKPSFQLQHSDDKRDDMDRFFMAFIKKGMLNVKFRFPVRGYFRFRMFAKNLQGSKDTLDYIGDILIKSKDINSDQYPYPKTQGLFGLKTDVLKYGIQSTSHDGEEIFSENGQVVMKFKVEPQTRASFKLEHAGTNRINLNRLRLAFIEGEYLIVKLRLPVSGYYNLQMFALNLSDSQNSNNDFIGQFLLSCTESCEDTRPYPEHWNLWGAKATATEYGFTPAIFSYNILSATDGEIAIDLPVDPSISVSFRLSHATDDIPDIGRYVFSFVQYDLLCVRARLPHSGFYKLSIFARHPNFDLSGCHDHIGDFLLENKSSIRNVKPYPTAFSTASEYGVNLLEPLSGDVPANEDVRFRMTSELAMRVMVNKEIVVRRDNNEFDVTVKTPGKGESVTIFVSAEKSGSLEGIYKYTCI